MLVERIASQPEVIRAIVSGHSPYCGVPHQGPQVASLTSNTSSRSDKAAARTAVALFSDGITLFSDAVTAVALFSDAATGSELL